MLTDKEERRHTQAWQKWRGSASRQHLRLQKVVFPDDRILNDYINISYKLNKSLSNKKKQLLAMN